MQSHQEKKEADRTAHLERFYGQFGKKAEQLQRYLDDALKDTVSIESQAKFADEIEEKGSHSIALIGKYWKKSLEAVQVCVEDLKKYQEEKEVFELLRGANGKSSGGVREQMEQQARILQARFTAVERLIQARSKEKQKIAKIQDKLNTQYEARITALIAVLDNEHETTEAKKVSYTKLSHFLQILQVSGVPLSYQQKILDVLSKHANLGQQPWYTESVDIPKQELKSAYSYKRRLEEVMNELEKNSRELDLTSHGLIEEEQLDRIKGQVKVAYVISQAAKQYRRTLIQQRDKLKSELCIVDVVKKLPKDPRPDSFVLLCAEGKPVQLYYYDVEGRNRKSVMNDDIARAIERCTGSQGYLAVSEEKQALETALRQAKLSDLTQVPEKLGTLRQLFEKIDNHQAALDSITPLVKKIEQMCVHVASRLDNVTRQKQTINDYKEMDDALSSLEEIFETGRVNPAIEARSSIPLTDRLDRMKSLIGQLDIQEYDIIRAKTELTAKTESIESRIAAVQDKQSLEGQQKIVALTREFEAIAEQLAAFEQFEAEKNQLRAFHDVFNKRLLKLKNDIPALLVMLNNKDAKVSERRAAFYRLQAFATAMPQVGLGLDIELAKLAKEADSALPIFTQNMQFAFPSIQETAASKIQKWQDDLASYQFLVQDPSLTATERKEAEERILVLWREIRNEWAEYHSAYEHLQRESAWSSKDASSTLTQLTELKDYTRWLKSFVSARQGLEAQLTDLENKSAANVQLGKFVSKEEKNLTFTYFLKPPTEDNPEHWELYRRSKDAKTETPFVLLERYEVANPNAETKEQKAKSYSLFWRLLGYKNLQTVPNVEEQHIKDQVKAAIAHLPVRTYDKNEKFTTKEQKQISEVTRLLSQLYENDVESQLKEMKLEIGVSVGERLASVITQLVELENKAKAQPLSAIDQAKLKILEQDKNYLENIFIQLNRKDVAKGAQARLLSHEELLATAIDISKETPLRPKSPARSINIGGGLFRRRHVAPRPSATPPAPPKQVRASTHRLIGALKPGLPVVSQANGSKKKSHKVKSK